MNANNRILPESEGNILCIEIRDKISTDFYHNTLEPAIGKILIENEYIKLLIVHMAPSPGWEEEAAEKDLRNLAELGHRVQKIALINPPEKTIIKWTTLQPLLSGPVKIFERENMEDALVWIKS